MIVDASVALKWLLAEPDAFQATALLTRPDLAAPDFIELEMVSSLARLARRGALTPEGVRKAWDAIPELPFRRVDWQSGVNLAFTLSLDLGAAYYDCLYLALALQRDDIVVTADARFVRAVQDRPALRGRAVLLSDL